MNKYTQITFDFNQAEDEEPSVGVRVKSFKTSNTEDNSDSDSTSDAVGETGPQISETEEEKNEATVLKTAVRGRKPLSSYKDEADKVNIPSSEELQKKQYYSIGEVAEMFAVNSSLLRYWETEFSILNPRKNKKGDRFYRPADIENIHLIYDLLRRRKLTIDGAREYMKKNKQSKEKFQTIQKLEEIKAFFREIQALLK